MIPAQIHQLWISPFEAYPLLPVPADVEPQCALWRDMHEGFAYKCWKLSEVLEFCRSNGLEDTGRAIRLCRLPAMQADLARLALLSVQGGFWVDLKLFPRVPFLRELLNFDLILIEHFPKDDFPDPTDFLINSLIGCRPGSATIQRAMEIATQNVLEKKPGNVFHLTGPTVLQAAFHESIFQGKANENEIKLLRFRETWDRLFSIGSSSYNDGARHWTARQELDCGLYF